MENLVEILVAETARKPIEDLSKLFEKLRKDKKFLKKRDYYLNII